VFNEQLGQLNGQFDDSMHELFRCQSTGNDEPCVAFGRQRADRPIHQLIKPTIPLVELLVARCHITALALARCIDRTSRATVSGRKGSGHGLR